MKTFTLINLLTKHMVTVEATNRLHARTQASALAGATDNDHIIYWITKQDYHDTAGYTVLA